MVSFSVDREAQKSKTSSNEGESLSFSPVDDAVLQRPTKPKSGVKPNGVVVDKSYKSQFSSFTI